MEGRIYLRCSGELPGMYRGTVSGHKSQRYFMRRERVIKTRNSEENSVI